MPTSTLKDIFHNRVVLPPKSPVVYFLFFKGKLVYIGQTTNPVVRLGQHALSIEFDSYSTIPASSNKFKREQLEAEYISLYSPKCNTQHNRILTEKKKSNSPFIPSASARRVKFHINERHKGSVVYCLTCDREGL